MQFKVLKSPLDKGETWEKEDSRIIEVCKSSDNRCFKPSVYFNICKEVGVKNKIKIIENIWFDTDVAIAIGKQMIKVAKEIDKEHHNSLILPPQKIKGKLVKGLTQKELDKINKRNQKK